MLFNLRLTYVSREVNRCFILALNNEAWNPANVSLVILAVDGSVALNKLWVDDDTGKKKTLTKEVPNRHLKLSSLYLIRM